MSAVAPAPQLPPLYGALVPLTQQQHQGLRLRDAGFGFARRLPAVPLAVEEFVHAARHMAVVFANQAPHLPLGILGPNADSNLFIDAEGRWRSGAYVPAYLRRYPFLLARLTPGAQEMALCLDPAAPHFSQAEGEPLFDDAGKPTPIATKAFEFTRALEASYMRTQEFVAALTGLSLLSPAAIQFESGGQQRRVDGFHAVNREVFNRLDGAQLVMLRDKGWLEAIHAHMLSVAALQAMAPSAA